MKLLSKNTKLIKADKYGYDNYGLSLYPNYTICPHASKQCMALCLKSSGLAGVFPSVTNARKAKTQYYLNDPVLFYSQLYKELRTVNKKSNVAIRLNTLSDINYEMTSLCDKYTNIKFYDYTKNLGRAVRYLNHTKYDITFSYSGENLENCIKYLNLGGRVAIPFSTRKNQDLPKKFMGFKVMDGDEHDLTFLRPKGVILGLRFKGNNKQLKKAIESNFAIDVSKF